MIRPPRFFGARHQGAAFSMVELLAAVAILAVILLVMFNISQQTSNAWRGARSKIDSFQDARLAFDSLTTTLGQATLNTYYDYFDASGRSARDSGFAGAHHYGRQSDLHFITGKSLISGQVTHSLFFQTPTGYDADQKYQGMDTLLNACGFFIVHDTDTMRPEFLQDGSVPNAPANGSRYRLMQFMQPSRQLGVYAFPADDNWFAAPLNQNPPPVQQLADNVIALVILPKKSSADGGTALSSDYEYNSRLKSAGATQLPSENQLPPMVEVVLVSIDETSARRLGEERLSEIEGLFQVPDELEANLATMEQHLIQRKLTYRIFRTVVALRNSKWSS